MMTTTTIEVAGPAAAAAASAKARATPRSAPKAAGRATPAAAAGAGLRAAATEPRHSLVRRQPKVPASSQGAVRFSHLTGGTNTL
jgi:hypothetical protein